MSQILGVRGAVDSAALGDFLARCQFKFGGVAKAPDGRPGTRFSIQLLLVVSHLLSIDPYHTYMSLAAASIYPPENADDSWTLPRLDVLWNATEETAAWLKEHVTNRLSPTA